MKKVYSILILLCISFHLLAQKQQLKNIPYIDQRRLHYGFSLGVDMADVSFEHSGKEWFAECASANPAFSVGLMGDLAFTENLSLRCAPTLHFVSRNITFINPSTKATIKQDLKSCNLEIPLSLKISTKRINNYRPYISTGTSVQFDLSREKETPIVFNRVDYNIHIALGCDSYLPYFKLCPELRFNLGLVDMIDHKRKGLKDDSLMQYTNAISSAHTKSISLIFYFE